MATINANICIRRDTAANWTSNNPTLLVGEMCYETDTGKFKVGTGTVWTSTSYGASGTSTITAPGLGAITRTVSDKLAELVSVKDFGAVGDGTTDDRAAIQAALDAVSAGGGTLYFPSGVYAMSSNVSNTQLGRTIARDLRITGENATIKCTSATHLVNMMVLNCSTGFSVEMDGIEWDGNNKVLNLVRFEQSTAQGVGSISLNGCAFRRSFGIVGGVGGNISNFALNTTGGFKKISITNCQFTDHSRALSVTTGGTQSCVINNSGAFFPEVTNVTGCLFSNITNPETAANGFNQDTDALVIFGGLTTGTTYIASSSTVTNNTFVNCKGRSVKVQADESLIANNVIKFSITPITGNAGGFIGMQGSSCIVRDNIFHYDLTSAGLNPFSTTGTAGATGGTVIGHSYDPLNNRPKNVVVTGNVVFNNVPKATGILNVVVNLFESSTPNLNMPGFCLVKDNQMCGGAVKTFVIAGLRTNATSPLYLTVADNAATEMTQSLMESAVSNFASNFVSCTNNINHNSTAVRHIVNASSPTTILDTNCNAFGNVNIGLALSKERTIAASFIPRSGIMAGLEENSGQFSIQSVTLANNADHTFPKRTFFGTSGLRFISATSFGGECNCLFSQSGGNLTSIFNQGAAAIATPSLPAGSTPSKINIGQEAGTFNIHIRNTLGDTRTFTLFSWG